VFGLLVVEDYVGGVMVGRVVKGRRIGGDRATQAMTRLFYAILEVGASGTGAGFSFTDADGVDRTFSVRGNYVDAHFFWNTSSCPRGVRVRFGSAITAPTRTDYRLANEFGVDANPLIVVDEAGGVVTVEGRFSSGVDRDVCEVGLTLVGTVSDSYRCGEVLLDRTVWSPCRSVPAGVPYAVRYRFVL